MAAAPSDGCPAQVPINVLTTKSTLSHFGERQTFLAQTGLLFSVYLQPLPSTPSHWWWKAEVLPALKEIAFWEFSDYPKQLKRR